MTLDAKVVSNIFQDCLFKEHPSVGTNFIKAEGITTNVGFNPVKIEKHVEEIKSLLDELHAEFKESSGGGWSFLQMYVDKNDNQWGDHPNMQELMLLGIATGYVNYLLPREKWSVLPGGVPYIVIHDERKEVELSQITA